MSAKRTYKEQARGRLLSFWERQEEYGAPIGCVTTTYTFDAAFFEEECLARFAGVESDPQENVHGYVIEREDKLSQVKACVLVDSSKVSPDRSLRWDLLPVRLPGGGILHAKVSLLVWENLVRVLIGSANLTEPGYRQHYELVGALDFVPDGEMPRALLDSVLEFLRRVRVLAPGSDRIGQPGPQRALDDFLSDTRKRVDLWVFPDRQKSKGSVAFVPIFPGEATLFESAAELFPARVGAVAAWVLSPFYNDGRQAREVVDALVGVMGVQGEREINFIGPGLQRDDEQKTIELELPKVLAKPWAKRRTHRFHWVPPVEDKDRRDLHAKSLWLERNDNHLFLIGSSNFTAAGTGVSGERANVEANLAYVMPPKAGKLRGVCWEAYPPYEEVDPGKEAVCFQSPDDRTPDAEGRKPLPHGFGLALFRPEGETGTLLLEIGQVVPEGFAVRRGDGHLLLTHEQWHENDRPGDVEIQWSDPKPPSHVLVEWKDDDGDAAAIWVVNVTEASRLPPPDELRLLELDDLLKILTSARPLHEIMGSIFRGRRKGTGGRSPRPDIETDPHRKVDTSSYLLRRMKRVAAGLEGLRQRLERPAWHVDSLRWRLEGPIGPITLAKRLAQEEPEATSFMLAEVALTVVRADWSRVEASLGAEVVREHVQRVVRQLREMAAAVPAPKNLEAYVHEVLDEVVT